MRFTFRAIAAGVLAGAAFFFFPFLLRFIFFVLLAGFVVRLVAGRRWRRYGWVPRYNDRQAFYHPFMEGSEDEVVPIDGQRYVSAISRKVPFKAYSVQ